MGVVQLGVVQVQLGSVQMGVVKLGVVQMGVDPHINLNRSNASQPFGITALLICSPSTQNEGSVSEELLISQEECGGRQRKERAPKSQLKFLSMK